MENKGKILIAGLVIVAIWLGFNIASDQSSQSQSGQQVAGDQSTADHHGGGIDQTIFNSLVGKKAKDFALESFDGENFKLSSLKGKNVVIFFSEGLMCYPACWDQIAAFGKDQRLNNENTITFTIVNDKKEEWKSAIDKMPELAQSIVLFDTDRSVSKVYGTLNLPSSMHRGQLSGHSYVIVDRDGIIRFARDDEQMAIRNDLLIQEIEKLN